MTGTETIAGAERHIVRADDALSALADHRRREKELTKALDALAAERRRLPLVEMPDHYVFETLEGEVTLRHLFGRHRQLILYHHMLKPDDPAPCSGCCMVADQIPRL